MLLGGCAAPPAGEDQRPIHPNVLLISIDTWRLDHLSLYGYERDTTPKLNVFADEAVVFDLGVNVGGATLPVHMSMMTSLHPVVHDVTPQSGKVLPEGRATWAETLIGQGYSTAAFTDGGGVRGKFGFDQGFEIYDDEGGHF
jgi:arylsulfatase A-like enzyme